MGCPLPPYGQVREEVGWGRVPSSESGSEQSYSTTEGWGGLTFPARRDSFGFGSWLGSSEFGTQVSERATPQDGGEQVRQSARAKAQRIAQEALDAPGRAGPDLQGRRKSDPQKVRLAARLRRETTMTLEWIADRRCRGTATHVASLLHRQSQKGP
jgi:hypothetical protein